MKILLLGGPHFLGRAIINSALAHGHEITLFNRGKSNPDHYPELEKLIGDRGGNLDALRGRQWDAVVDTCGYVPRVVRASAELLANAVEHYTFISSISAYASFRTPHFNESAPVGALKDEAIEEITNETYGPLKALCEQVAEAAMPGRVLNVRAGLLVGPHDPTDRFTYWPVRIARGGRVLAPGHPGFLTQFVDVRDLADWIVRMAERHQTGVYNATGPESPLPLGELLETCREVSGSGAEVVWVEGSFLIDAGVSPWTELPLWVPDSNADFAGFMQVDCRKAIGEGLTFRPLAETVRDTLAWASTRPADREWQAGLSPQREAELIAAWEMRRGMDN